MGLTPQELDDVSGKGTLQRILKPDRYYYSAKVNSPLHDRSDTRTVYSVKRIKDRLYTRRCGFLAGVHDLPDNPP